MGNAGEIGFCRVLPANATYGRGRPDRGMVEQNCRSRGFAPGAGSDQPETFLPDGKPDFDGIPRENFLGSLVKARSSGRKFAFPFLPRVLRRYGVRSVPYAAKVARRFHADRSSDRDARSRRHPHRLDAASSSCGARGSPPRRQCTMICGNWGWRIMPTWRRTVPSCQAASCRRIRRTRPRRHSAPALHAAVAVSRTSGHRVVIRLRAGRRRLVHPGPSLIALDQHVGLPLG